ncbi:hypothetical protein TNCV_3461 [Trichonephila clavipes]|nr:hypothetical protein TNCV_3461 [Trichonephila clavipes]
MNLSLSITQLEEKLKIFPEIADDKLSRNYADAEFEIFKKVQIKSDDSTVNNNQNTNTFSTGMKEKRSLKNISPFTQRNNNSGSSGQISTLSSETTLVKGTKYTFYDDDGEKFIIDNADFEEDEKELIDIFNTSLASLGPCNESFHFKPSPTNALPDNPTDENDIIPKADFEEEEKISINILNSNLASLSNNSNFEMGFYNKAFHFSPTPTDASSVNCTDENWNENVVASSQKKNVFKKMKCFFKKVVKNKSTVFSYKRF